MKIPKLKWPDIQPPVLGVKPAKLPARLLWMAGIWVCSILLLLLLAGILRLILRQ